MVLFPKWFSSVSPLHYRLWICCLHVSFEVCFVVFCRRCPLSSLVRVHWKLELFTNLLISVFLYCLAQVKKLCPNDPDATKKLKECEKAVMKLKFEEAISVPESQRRSIADSIDYRSVGKIAPSWYFFLVLCSRKVPRPQSKFLSGAWLCTTFSCFIYGCSCWVNFLHYMSWHFRRCMGHGYYIEKMLLSLPFPNLLLLVAIHVWFINWGMRIAQYPRNVEFIAMRFTY